MSWHQGLQDPIPNFTLQLQDPPRLKRKRGDSKNHAPITWGRVKALSAQANGLLEQQGLEKTDENFLVAVIAALNANSLTLIMCLMLVTLGGGVAQGTAELPKENVWEAFANSLNQSSFCLTNQVAVGDVLGTCMIPVCHDPEDVQEFSWFYQTLEANNSLRSEGYRAYYNWGQQAHSKPRLAMQLRTPRMAGYNMTCARVVNCTGRACVYLGKENSLNCSRYTNVSYVFKFQTLPLGWFWTCSGYTFNYIPANLTHGTKCCLSRLSLVLPPKDRHVVRSRRSIHLDSTCDSEVKLLSKAQYTALAVSLIGVPGLAVGNAKNIHELACWAMKSLNATSTALALLNREQAEIRHGLLQNRAAIDYLLLLHHRGCEEVEGMCCFDIRDNSKGVYQQIQVLKNLTNRITIQTSFWDGLWDELLGWLPDFHWLKQAVKYVVIAICVLILGCCALQCIPNLLAMCVNGLPKGCDEHERRLMNHYDKLAKAKGGIV